MQIIRSIHILYFLFGIVQMHAQFSKTIHQTFDLDSVTELRLDLIDSFRLEPWNSSSLMVQTSTRMFGASQSLLDFVIKEGRYDVEVQRENGVLHVRHKNPKRVSFQFKNAEFREEIEVIIYYPTEFYQIEPTLLSRPEDTNAATIRKAEVVPLTVVPIDTSVHTTNSKEDLKEEEQTKEENSDPPPTPKKSKSKRRK